MIKVSQPESSWARTQVQVCLILNLNFKVSLLYLCFGIYKEYIKDIYPEYIKDI